MASLDDGVDHQADQAAHHGTVDADVLQVAADLQFELVDHLAGVPAGDDLRDEGPYRLTTW